MSQKEQVKKAEVVVKNDATLKVVETPKPTQEQPKAVISEASKVEQVQEVKRLLNPTAEQRLKSLEQMKILGEKFTFLKVKEDELEKFILSSDGTKEKISLSNASGFKFEVSNSQTIEKVLEVIAKDLKVFTERGLLFGFFAVFIFIISLYMAHSNLKNIRNLDNFSIFMSFVFLSLVVSLFQSYSRIYSFDDFLFWCSSFYLFSQWCTRFNLKSLKVEF